jgi:hypothetical protein
MTRKRGWYWPWLVTASLLFTVGVNVVMLFAATGDRNGAVVEPDYYRKAVEWDLTMARREASDRLGWVARASLLEAEGDSGTLVVEATGVDGAPVRGARFTGTLIHNRDAAHPTRAVLEERSAGRYESRVPIAHLGRWEVRLEGRRDAERFVTTLHAEAFTR